MKILAIETSCDETAIAIIDKKGMREFCLLANVVSSQVKIHEKFGGVVPNLARREHEKNLVPVLLKALKEAKLLTKKREIKDQKQVENIEKILEREIELKYKFKKYLLPLLKPKIDAIAVTYGPGLAPALWAGVNFGKALAALWQLSLTPVNHMEGHIFSALIKPGLKNTSGYLPRGEALRGSLLTTRYPAIALLVSGGHTELHLVKKLGSYKRLGETLDDAAGEAFDKVAKMLGLPYPGGPEISKLAEKGNPHAIAFPRPMLQTDNFDFSFSGLKTSVLYYIRDHPKYSLADVAASFEEAAVEVLTSKTMRAAKKYKAQTILIGGGVAANKKLRKEFKRKISENLPETELLMPGTKNTGDNALMIALAAAYSDKKNAPKPLGAEPGLRL